ncbi:MAG: acylphosphatase [Parcubacteria group bacterium]|nr:acylphosphatase [Parcubacteria group bacterium]
MRKRIHFYGVVQGVGFRYVANVVAEKYGLYGWVRNNKDGSVTLVFEGLKDSINEALDYLKKFFKENIDHVEEIEEPEEKLISFEIKHEA